AWPVGIRNLPAVAFHVAGVGILGVHVANSLGIILLIRTSFWQFNGKQASRHITLDLQLKRVIMLGGCLQVLSI
ncbi:MAG: hypothetical protein R6U69_04550, partial [Marinobacter sp.]|uniref:hypothetical protein n=1 Tax=Marinobacter sp. TaxID=50741 RepID=UPI0039767AAB